jgi:signal transduction histidine kinase
MLSHAIKFTDQGEVILVISGDEELNIKISDTGIGIGRT